MFLIDTHTHIDQIENLDEAFNRAENANVKAVVALSVDLASCRRNLEIIRRYNRPKIFLGLGIHPGEIRMEELPECLDLMRAHVNEISVVGEIGLDFWYQEVRKNEVKKEEQRRVFREMLSFAAEDSRPVSVHSRGKWLECFETVRDEGIEQAVFHWYSGPVDVLEKILSRGYFVSFTPSLAYSPEAQAAALATPLTQALIETDCPVYYRDKETGDGFSSEPRDVFKTLELFCRLKNIDPQETADILNRNAMRFLGVDHI